MDQTLHDDPEQTRALSRPGPPPEALPSGTVVGRYTISETIGIGGMGRVEPELAAWLSLR